MFYLQKGTWDVLTTRWWARWLLRTDPTAKLCRGRQPWSLSADNSTGSYKGIPELSFDKASKPPGLLLPKLKIAWSSHGKAVDLGVGKVWGSHLTLTDLVSLDKPFSLWASPNVHVDLGKVDTPLPQETRTGFWRHLLKLPPQSWERKEEGKIVTEWKRFLLFLLVEDKRATIQAFQGLSDPVVRWRCPLL